jgi:hypothetical protein
MAAVGRTTLPPRGLDYVIGGETRAPSNSANRLKAASVSPSNAQGPASDVLRAIGDYVTDACALTDLRTSIQTAAISKNGCAAVRRDCEIRYFALCLRPGRAQTRRALFP